MENTIQIHPHDVRDEGAETVVRNIVERSGIRTIIAETGTLEERHPYPRGELLHNPVHKVFYTDACFEVPDSEAWFKNLSFRPRLSPQAQAGEDYIKALRDVAPQYGAEVMPWVKALNAAFEGDCLEACVMTFSGEPIKTWLCPNNPLTEVYVKNLMIGMLERYPSRAILVDRLRYPDWSGATVSLGRMLTCFCPHCVTMMDEAGIELELLDQLITAFYEEPGLFVNWRGQQREVEVLASWFQFRNRSITNLAEKLWEEVRNWRREARIETKYWLNLWPPSFAPILGQDYPSLGRLCEGAKHFPYHKLGGGADLSAFVRALRGEGTSTNLEDIFCQVRTLLRLDPVTFAHYEQRGLPVSFVAEQTKWGKDAFRHNKIFTGIQIWDIPESEIQEAIQAAWDGGADGLFFYCYGWASLSALDQIGELLGR